MTAAAHYKKRLIAAFANRDLQPQPFALHHQESPLDLSMRPSTSSARPSPPTAALSLLSVANCLYRCFDCEHSFTAPERLKAHQRRHRIKASGRYRCKLCNKSFVQQSSLMTHIRIHTGHKPYKCLICENSYGDLSTFTKHKRTHSGEKPYKCTICNKAFSQSGNCLRHIRTVHKQN